MKKLLRRKKHISPKKDNKNQNKTIQKRAQKKKEINKRFLTKNYPASKR